jgi:hypothetical protein
MIANDEKQERPRVGSETRQRDVAYPESVELTVCPSKITAS